MVPEKQPPSRHSCPHCSTVKNMLMQIHIAQALSPFHPESVAIQAGKLMLRRIQHLAAHHINFAFETTLSAKTFVPFLENCKKEGYTVTIIFFWLNTPELAIQRVRERVLKGGHHIPQDVIIRRYARGISHFKNYYLSLADNWYVYNNSTENPILIAKKIQNNRMFIYDHVIWNTIIEEH
jgi:predicted ABC-type ATPase